MADENEIQEYSNEPDVDALKADLDRCRTSLSYYIDRAEEARDMRMSVWPGKNRSGQKTHKDAFPWVNASDLENNLSSNFCDEDSAILKSALVKSNICSPTESADILSSKMVTEFMRWRLGSMNELQERLVWHRTIYWNKEFGPGVYLSGSKETPQTHLTDEVSAISPQLATAILDPDMKEESCKRCRLLPQTF